MDKKLDSTLAPAYEAVRSTEARTGRARIIYAKNYVLSAINELESLDAHDGVRGIIGILGNAEDALADLLND